MGRRRRVEHTEEWALIEPLLPWHEQREYELLRPIVLFGDTPAERAGQTGAAARTLHEKARRFDEEGVLVLRRMEMSDVDDLMGIFSDHIVMRYYPATKSRREAEEWVRWTLESYRDHGFGQWVAILKESDEFAGQCGLTMQEVEGKEEVEIGYLFLRKFWGRGLATEAARKARDHGFHTLGHERLVSLIDPRNIASRRVAEKVGLALEKEVWKRKKKVCVYAISKNGSAP